MRRDLVEGPAVEVKAATLAAPLAVGDRVVIGWPGSVLNGQTGVVADRMVVRTADGVLRTVPTQYLRRA